MGISRYPLRPPATDRVHQPGAPGAYGESVATASERGRVQDSVSAPVRQFVAACWSGAQVGKGEPTVRLSTRKAARRNPFRDQKRARHVRASEQVRGEPLSMIRCILVRGSLRRASGNSGNPIASVQPNEKDRDRFFYELWAAALAGEYQRTSRISQRSSGPAPWPG